MDNHMWVIKWVVSLYFLVKQGIKKKVPLLATISQLHIVQRIVVKIGTWKEVWFIGLGGKEIREASNIWHILWYNVLMYHYWDREFGRCQILGTFYGITCWCVITENDNSGGVIYDRHILWYIVLMYHDWLLEAVHQGIYVPSIIFSLIYPSNIINFECC